MKAFFIVNPIAGGGRGRRAWGELESRLPAWLAWEQRYSEAPGHARALARQASDAGYDVVVPVGGDGTINEAVNGLMAAGLDHQFSTYRGPEFCVIPAGRGNDFARTLGIGSPDEALDRLLSGSRRAVDVGWVRLSKARERRYFMNIAGSGIDARAAALANRMPRAMRGPLPYVAGILVSLILLTNPRCRIEMVDPVSVPGFPLPSTLRSDRLVVEGRFSVAAIGVGRYLGGGMDLLPLADPCDGYLDICVGEDLGRAELVRLLMQVFSGGHLGHSKVSYFRARRVVLDGPPDIHVQADGEPLGQGSTEFGLLPNILRG